ncbi:MAG: hypothetical protein DRN08_05255 [Thermoplasmata archaeon]|nr:MAG: hypothetical protein DRN08_05255 [Thermoplasmata archaeon]
MRIVGVGIVNIAASGTVIKNVSRAHHQLLQRPRAVKDCTKIVCMIRSVAPVIVTRMKVYAQLHLLPRHRPRLQLLPRAVKV